MGSLIQFCTEASRKDEAFDKGVWPAAGMGYVFVTANGKLLVIDGGQTEKDANDLIALLEKHSGNRPPVVDLWIITHAHEDHYGALNIIAHSPELLKKVTVRKLCFRADAPVTFHQHDQERISALPALLGCEVNFPRRGDVIRLDDLEIRMLYTWEEDPKIEDVKTFNRLSLIFTVTNAEHKAMFIGDSSGTGPSFVRKNESAETLKSDFLQLAHHGLDGGDIGFYRMVAPTTVLIPCSLGGAKYIKAPETPCNYHNRYIQERALNVICASVGTVELDF